jgi:hypothetical protein
MGSRPRKTNTSQEMFRLSDFVELSLSIILIKKNLDLINK